MSAAANVQLATQAANLVSQLIDAETQDQIDDQTETASDAVEDAQDLANLRKALNLLNVYIAATTQEIGTADDQDDMNTMIRRSLGY